jgi:hypothetical protein
MFLLSRVELRYKSATITFARPFATFGGRDSYVCDGVPTMGKKKGQKFEKEFLPRKGDMTIAELTTAMNELDQIIGDVRGILKSMAEDKIDAINVDGIQKVPRAKELLQELSGNIWMGLHRARVKLGKATRLPVSNKP